MKRPGDLQAGTGPARAAKRVTPGWRRVGALDRTAPTVHVHGFPRHHGVARSLDYLSRHWHQPIRVEDLVRASAMSRRGFLKAFRRHFRHGPAAELRRVRLDAAKVLLVQSDLTLAAIGEKCGYPLPNSFSVAFKIFTGQTPGEYRDLNRSPSATHGSLREMPRLLTA